MTSNSTRPAHLTINDPKAAKLLFGVRTADFLRVLFPASCTIAELAATTETHESTTLAYLNRMIRAGLVVQDGTKVVNGRTLKLFRATADEFVIPFPFVEDFMLTLERRAQQQFNQLFTQVVLDYHYTTEQIGVLVRPNEQGQVSYCGAIGTEYEYFPTPGRGPLVQFTWVNLYLTEQEAVALQTELEQIAKRYIKGPSASRKRFLMGTHLVPETT